jgi:ribokinase
MGVWDLTVRPAQRYDALVGTGGLGSGIYLALDDNETIGREESRGAYLLDRRDFGKLHIIAHYVQKLLGEQFVIVPIGRVGDDSAGEEVKRELQRVGIELTYVSTDPQLRTLFSVCFAYPSGEGGNLTALNSASAAVTVEAVRAAEPVFERFQHRGIALVVPEVPILAREALLSLATDYDFLRVGSFVAGELRSFAATSLFRHLDLLSINLEEAAAFAGVPPGGEPKEVVSAAVEAARSENSELLLVVTAGKSGSWAWDGKTLTYDRGIPAEVANSAGAGDAHVAGLVVGLASGLTIVDANAFATILSALKVGAEDTISWAIDAASVVRAAAAYERPLPSDLLTRLALKPDGTEGKDEPNRSGGRASVAPLPQ